MLNFIASWMFILVALWTTFFVIYQLGLACLYFLIQDRPVHPSEPRKRFAVVIPAHNEETMVGTAIDSWMRVHYPRNLFDVYIIADNCLDRTVEIARAHGAVCLEREDLNRTGKGYALAWALRHVNLKSFDAVVFVDADTTITTEFLGAMNNRLVNGAKVIQGFDGVLNPDDTIMTRLMQITNVMKNLLFNHAKSKLGLSVQLMGTGMCFDRVILEEVGWKAFSIGEDGEQFAYLAVAGIHVDYEPKAISYAQEASSFGQAYTQRVRWASGRMRLLGVGIRLLIKGIREMDFRLIDAALTFLIPNYSMLANVTLISIIITLFIEMPGGIVLTQWFLVLLGAQVLYFGLGISLSSLSTRALLSLSFAPIFLLWKIGIDLIAILHLRRSVWVRTRRVMPKEKGTP